MAQQNYMHTGLLLIIEKHMGFLHAMESYLITRVQEEEIVLCLKKLLKQFAKFHKMIILY